MDLWHCQLDGGTEGLFAVSLLQMMAQEGRVTPETLVCRVGDSQWTTAAHIPGLFAAAATTAVPVQPTQFPLQPQMPTEQVSPVQPTAVMSPTPEVSPQAAHLPPAPAMPAQGATAAAADEEGPATAADRMLQRRRRNSAGAMTYALLGIGVILVLVIVIVALLTTGGKDDEQVAERQPAEPPLTAQLAIERTAPWREAGRTTSSIGKRAKIRVVAASLEPDVPGPGSGRLTVNVEVENTQATILEFQDVKSPLSPGSIDPTKPLAIDAQGRFLEYVGPTYRTHDTRPLEERDGVLAIRSHQIGAQMKDTLEFEFLCEADPGPYVRVAIPLAWFENSGFLGFQVARDMWEDAPEAPSEVELEPQAEPVEAGDIQKIRQVEKDIGGPSADDRKGKLPKPEGFDTLPE